MNPYRWYYVVTVRQTGSKVEHGPYTEDQARRKANNARSYGHKVQVIEEIE